MSGREGEPDVAGVGQDSAPRPPFAWVPPGARQQGGEPETEDFGPRPLASHLDDDVRTDSAPHPVPTDPASSGPYYTEPNVSGPHYAEQTPSGPQPRQYADPNASDPHYAEQTPSGPQPRQYADPNASDPHYAEQTPSGP
ncbi:MAG: hypothetical protein GEV28_28625, partial [Actinophytocola sp.]|nr:hypothetical protein [Actinophytocola sp.]